MEGLTGSAVGCGGAIAVSSYCFKYACPERVPAIGWLGSAAKTIVSSSESVSEGISVSASQKEAHTTLQDEAFALPLDFLLVTVVHCRTSSKSGWTHMISP